MPVIKKGQKQETPEWSEVSHYGIVNVPAGGEVEMHYQDAHEYWVIVKGTLTAISEGKTYELGQGDFLLTKMGDEHALKAKEDVTLVYIYGRMRPGGKFGHLHR